MVTCDSVTGGNHMSEIDRKKLGLSVVRKSTRQLEVANGGVSKGKHVTHLSFSQLLKKAAEIDIFDDFKTSLLSVLRKDSRRWQCIGIYKRKCEMIQRDRYPYNMWGRTNINWGERGAGEVQNPARVEQRAMVTKRGQPKQRGLEWDFRPKPIFATHSQTQACIFRSDKKVLFRAACASSLRMPNGGNLY